MKPFLILLLCCTLNSFGATFYVATNGNDGAAGTIGAPWQHVRYGVMNMNGGDTLNMRGGTFNDDGFELDEIKSGPGTNQPTIIQSYPGEWATYYPTTIGNTNDQSGSGPHGILLSSKSNIVLNSFELNALNCWGDGIKITGLGASYITLTNLTVRNSYQGHGILTSGGVGDGERLFGLITHCRVLTNAWGATAGNDRHQIYLQHSDVVVEDCFFYGITNIAGKVGYGVQSFTTATNVTFRNNFFTNCLGGAMGFLGSGGNWNSTIYNNVAVNCDKLADIRNSHDCYVLNNSGHGNDTGIIVVGSTNIWVQNNISEGTPANSQAGIYLESSSNVFVSFNLCATNSVDFTIYKTLGATTNNNLFQKVTYVDPDGTNHKFTNSTTYVTAFVDSAAGNLRVLAASDAIGRGTPQTIFNTDAAGNLRINWTIGAYEFLMPTTFINNALIYNVHGL